MNRIGILDGAGLRTGVSARSLARAVEKCGARCRARSMAADRLSAGALAGVDVLVNPLGRYYPDRCWDVILSYYRSGGVILTIGAEPFTVPFAVERGRARALTPNHDALHAISVVDAWTPTGPAAPPMRAEVLSPRYRFLDALIARGAFPRMSKTCSGYYRMGDRPDRREQDSSYPIIEAQLERACGWRDPAGRLVAVPIVRIDRADCGTLIFLNFEPADPAFYGTAAGVEFLAGMFRTALQEPLRLTVSASAARYFEHETPRMSLALERLNAKRPAAGPCEVAIALSNAESGEVVRSWALRPRPGRTGAAHAARSLGAMPEGFYRLKATVSRCGEPLLEKSTGFYKISDGSIRRVLAGFAPISIDPKRSADFCLQGGRPFAMHGTNYHTTDVYRQCFIDLNAWQCDRDMREIRAAGFNILRTGIWRSYDRFYHDDGRIRDNALRSLDAFFLTAARHGLPVQFVMGAFVMNHWDRGQCPVHNPEMRAKNVVAFASFAERFAGWPNVQVDAINEPSYSWEGKWTPARPSGDEHERRNWTRWLKKRYRNDLSALRDAWGLSSRLISSFQGAALPDTFVRHFDHKGGGYHPYASLKDFYDFARESFSDYVGAIRRAVKARDRKMLFMIGRDESLRIPSQQDEAYRGHFDMVNWHQWHRNAVVFSEYFLNRVRGLPCCGQEIGVYHYADLRGLPRRTDVECARLLERKLLYSFGNWLQWQAYCDMHMGSLSEINLGLFRADRTETPHLETLRALAWVEQRTAPLMLGRDERAIDVLVVHPSNYYFSADNALASNGVHNMITALHYHAKGQADCVLEHTFRRDNATQIGDPKLIVFPLAQTLTDEAWDLLLEYARAGKAVLVSGAVDNDGYRRRAGRLEALGLRAETRHVLTEERLRIGARTLAAGFRTSAGYYIPAHPLDKTVFPGEPTPRVRVVKLGRGKLILCPLPIELADGPEPAAELYRFAFAEAGVKPNVCRMLAKPTQNNILFYPLAYRRCTVVTVVNEGADDEVEFTDLASGVRVAVDVKAERGAKVWLDTRGGLLAAYLTGRLKVGRLAIVPNGTLALCRRGQHWAVLAGRREKPYIRIGSRRIDIGPDRVFREFVVAG